ncbi:MAG: helix-turn-helix domain-containing protein [Acetobacteraceae bacterium]|nr:helix-turn-helix domain-containing protein [Acetobacteraceae bacterium]MBV8523707.1 helix-turn-helix domain-containing protein [Acetobacteraceae bacterium]MBV8590502.1 helix-turn-helix domain-containing protein [Acetobacteraceae bacterium]
MSVCLHDTDEPDYLLVDSPDATERMGRRIPYKKIYAAVLDGGLPAYRVDGRWRVKHSALQDFVARK